MVVDDVAADRLQYTRPSSSVARCSEHKRCCLALRPSALATLSLFGSSLAAPMPSRTLPRLVAAAGFALLCYAAFDTIHRASHASTFCAASSHTSFRDPDSLRRGCFQTDTTCSWLAKSLSGLLQRCARAFHPSPLGLGRIFDSCYGAALHRRLWHWRAARFCAYTVRSPCISCETVHLSRECAQV